MGKGLVRYLHQPHPARFELWCISQRPVATNATDAAASAAAAHLPSLTPTSMISTRIARPPTPELWWSEHPGQHLADEKTSA